MPCIRTDCSAWVSSLLAFLCLLGSGAALCAEKAGFWLAIRSNTVIDRQVAEEIGARAGMIVLRAPAEGKSPGYSFPEIVARLKTEAPDTPVLSYAQISRIQTRGRIETHLLSGLDFGPLLDKTTNRKGREVSYVNITDTEVRRRIVERLAVERRRLGVDGFAVDLASRKPSVRPRALANICDAKPSFCDLYARSMDDVFSRLNAALGAGGTLLYNGLWNLAPGMLADQAQLLLHADAASIEYFGMVPGERRVGFTENILPYLDSIPRLPKGKPVLFFARGPWRYMDYVADYSWQRYLYASFLLVRRPGDMFKYHTSFQIPAHAGRVGGMDIYSDWKHIDLGNALGPYRVEGGLYLRDFARGRVVVAPDDGNGGQTRLTAPRFTPEGQQVSGEVSVAPGQALILLDARPEPQPARHLISARKMASWGWTNADLVAAPDGEWLHLHPLPAGLEGEHDIWLDIERSLSPFQRLELTAVLQDPAAAALAVAEVDDPRGEHAWVVVAVQPSGSTSGTKRLREAVQFRTSHLARERWPWLYLEHKPNSPKPIVLDGPAVFSATDYRFRRWSHLRLVGPLKVSAVRLSRRADAPYSAGAPAGPDKTVSPPTAAIFAW